MSWEVKLDLVVKAVALVVWKSGAAASGSVLIEIKSDAGTTPEEGDERAGDAIAVAAVDLVSIVAPTDLFVTSENGLRVDEGVVVARATVGAPPESVACLSACWGAWLPVWVVVVRMLPLAADTRMVVLGEEEEECTRSPVLLTTACPLDG